MELFESRKEFSRFSNIDLSFVDAIYGSSKQIYSIKTFKTQKQLIEEWGKSENETAVKIQSRLEGALKGLQWDIYLVLVVNEVCDPVVQKAIENDRNFFRKILLTKENQPFIDYLPFALNIDQNEGSSLVFNDFEFLTELKELLSLETINRLGNEYFLGQNGENYIENTFLKQYNGGVEE